ncbi:MAG: hypothetical protein GX442_18525 [Candidatus Riflebacteria bacterium]|nr:hypothetical protein [Candidatus Riflebacteria bacterium]
MAGDRRLGLLGTFGFFVFWLVVSYGLVAGLGYGFLADLRFIQPRFPLSPFLENLERDRSELGWPLRKLRVARNAWRESLGRAELAAMDGVVTAEPSGLYLGDPREMEAKLFTDRGEGGRGRGKEVLNPTPARVWKDWIGRSERRLPLPDPYGFPMMPVGSPDTMQRFFPLLAGERQPPGADQMDRGPFGDGLDLIGTEGPVSFPLLWRHEKMLESFAHKRKGFYAWLVLVLVGMVVTGAMFFAPMPDFGEVQFLQVFGIIFGIVTLGSVLNFRTCYRPRYVSDAEEIEQSTVDEIKHDCQRYLEALQQEGKMTNEQARLMSRLVERR